SKVTFSSPQFGIVEHTKTELKGRILDKQLIAFILANCESTGGTPEQLTVEAGVFQTCKLSHSDKDASWIGMAPFGFIKYYLTYDDNFVEFELSSYHFANP
ncbi:MAG: hypothetical protein NZ480_08215, partial [Bdellovibrionaceae bacterium]|nr:hypothetical protein [Pseudobdellovibrionaceae bacterium]MDW8189523.1 hypothetical protein [Pseudobdellovibrionaceae bacterium]